MNADLRLAVPVSAGWIALAILIGMPDALPAAVAVGWSCTAALVLVALGVSRRPPRAHRVAANRLAKAEVARGRAPDRTPGLDTVLVVAVLAAAATSVLLSAAAVEAPQRRPAALVEAAASGRHLTATAIVNESVLVGDDSFRATLESVAVGGRTTAVSVPVRLFGARPAATLAIGTVVSVSGAVARTEDGDDLSFLLFASSAPRRLFSPPPVLAVADDLRAGLRAATASLPGSGGDLLPGLAIGDTSSVSDQLDEVMKAASLSHLTAVSGANCAVVVGLIMLAGAALEMRRGVRVAASVVVLAGFVVLVTPEPSVLRAAVMATIALVGLARGRPGRGVPLVALAVLVLLATDPWLARDYGFVLSVLATTGLLVLAGPLTEVFAGWLTRPVAACIAIPLSAQLACQPVLILLAPAIPTYGVAANVLAAPAAPVATVLGLLSCVLLPVLPAAGELVAQAAWVPAAWIAAVAEYVGTLPGHSLPWLEGPLGVGVIVLITVCGLLVLLVRGAESGRVRLIAALVIAAVAVGHLGVTAGTAIRTAVFRPGDWQYAACDVGQGDAMVVRSAGAVALIDTGPEPAALAACLDGLGIDHVDLLVLTHFDIDHVGGTSAVEGLVDDAIVGPSDGADADALVGGLRRTGTIVHEVSEGATGRVGDLRWTALWPPDPLRGVLPGNDASIVLRFDGAGSCATGCLSAVFLGDVGRESQVRLLGTGALDAVDVVKVAHHGSADQEEELYRTLRARVGLVGVGADNDYGHPTDELLGILASTGTEVERTDTAGLVLVSPAGSDPAAEPLPIEVWTERGG